MSQGSPGPRPGIDTSPYSAYLDRMDIKHNVVGCTGLFLDTEGDRIALHARE